jgi:hypothetical protein
MGALNPLFLAAAVAVAVPIFLHLFQRHETRRYSFPALRYLERTEKEHARRIKLRQLLLLLTRVAILLLLVGAGARLIFAGRGASHPPTAVAIILDNSLSSGLVVGETRVLDELKALARAALGQATDEDRFWVIRAGEPWLPAIPGGAPEARAAVDATEASDGEGDLTAALERAVELLQTSDLLQREIHLLSDMQRTGFVVPGGAPAGGAAVVAWAGEASSANNRALTAVLVGGGLPPLEGQRTALTVRALEGDGDSTRWAVRVVLDGRVRAAGEVGAGAEASIALPPTVTGWVTGYADADPDALRADDRRFFAYRSRGAPAVSVSGAPSLFVAQAIGVLERSGRIAIARPSTAELLVASEGLDLEVRGERTSVLVVPPDDVTLLPALNRRLAEAGIGWRYQPRASVGEGEIGGESVPEALAGVRVARWYAMERADDRTTPTQTIAEVAGDPWALGGTDANGRRYLLLASPLTSDATTLPVSTGMVRFIDWVATEWAGSGGAIEYTVGDHVAAPPAATHVRFPSGREMEIDGTRTVRGTGEAGTYEFLEADTAVLIVALNPPPSESRLARLDDAEIESAIGPEVTVVESTNDWTREAYRSRRGPELWWPLLLAACLLLITESIVATAGRASQSTAQRRTAVAAEA